jgi:hypothetical protein
MKYIFDFGSMDKDFGTSKKGNVVYLYGTEEGFFWC